MSVTSPLMDTEQEKVDPDVLQQQEKSNLRILFFTSILFGLFVVAEIIGALASNSLSLLGDAAAMIVDVFSYSTNMYAEYKKMKREKITPFMKKLLEIYIPTFSVCALLGVTAWILSDAIEVLRNNGNDSEEVNVYFLYGFATANFLVDVISSFLFYQKKDTVLIAKHELRTFSLDRRSVDWHKRTLLPNLNMISALTHVGGDTLRTASVFIAAVISTAANQNGALCDAWAAVVVSFTIFCAVIPLCNEIYKAATRDEEEDSNLVRNVQTSSDQA